MYTCTHAREPDKKQMPAELGEGALRREGEIWVASLLGPAFVFRS